MEPSSSLASTHPDPALNAENSTSHFHQFSPAARFGLAQTLLQLMGGTLTLQLSSNPLETRLTIKLPQA